VAALTEGWIVSIADDGGPQAAFSESACVNLSRLRHDQRPAYKWDILLSTAFEQCSSQVTLRAWVRNRSPRCTGTLAEQYLQAG
jgi:hypothetical protein